MLGLSGCGKEEKSLIPPRPSTAARIEILEPTPNQVTGADVTVRVRLTGGREVQTFEGPQRPDEGHIHLSLDGQVVAMAFGEMQQLHVEIPGPHAVQVEFTAIDNLPFKNRVIAAVLFTVQP
jgi:hypothetical protein